MADDETGYRLSDRFVYEGVDPTTGERFHFRANAGETRVPSNEREEQALKSAVEQGVGEEVELTGKSASDAKHGGSRKGAIKPPSKPEATEAELAAGAEPEPEEENQEPPPTEPEQPAESAGEGK